MRMVKMISCTVWLVACCLLVSAAERADEPKRSRIKASLRDASVDAAPVDNGLAAIAAASAACETIGAFTAQFVGTNRFRGDVFTIDKQVDLIEIEMELALHAATDSPLELFFYVFEESANDPATFDVIFESIINATGDGQPTFYESGPVETPGGAPLTLEAGKRYAIGAAWTSTSGSPSTIRYGSDGLIFPRPFVAGTIEGLVSINQPPPLLTLGTPVVFRASGAYSLRLCLSGACCDGSSCIDLSQVECSDLGGEFTAAGITCTDDIDTCPPDQGACCLDSQTCFDLNEFACDANGGAWNDGIACDDASDPCAPRGACCRPSQNPPCTPDVTENRCALLGGTYRGDDVDCDASPGCGAGACCVAEGCVELTQVDCESQTVGGVFTGPGTSCDVDVCVPTGACCNGLTCSDVTEEACDLVFGTSFRGDGTSCATLTTACGKGACCLPGAGCFDGSGGAGEGVSELFCESQNGIFRGDGTTCATISPACEGVCCFGPGGSLCAQQTAPELCWGKFGGDFAGYFVTGCTSDPDATPIPIPAPCSGFSAWACCLPNGGCTETDAVTCIASLAGSFMTDEDCSPDLCLISAPVGVCCESNPDTCTNGVIDDDCALPNIWIEGAACGDSPDPCLPVGACCDGELCTDDGVIDDDCAFTWTEGATCSDIPDPCAPTGSCCNSVTFECLEDVVVDACAGAHLTFALAMTCVEAACPLAPLGACCAITSDIVPPCSQQTQADCESLGGQYQGDGALCAGIACGACCQLSGTCQDNAVASECIDPDFDFFNAGFACEDVCTPRGACCVDGTCNNGLTPLACQNMSGVYAGDNTLCNTGSCDIGACCGTNETCADATTRSECEAGGGRFLDTDSTCSSPTDEICRRGVCCEPDATCTSDKIILDCMVEQDFIPGSTSCDIAECFVRGACCLANESCKILSQITCLLNNGIYAGNGTACEVDLCAVGACCDAVLGCAESSKLGCTRTSGIYAGAGTLCLGGPGVSPPDDCSTARGACCNGGTCAIETEANCISGGGSYAGDNVACDADLCTVVTCCLSAGGCDGSSFTQFECEGGGGTVIGIGIACLGTADECTTGSCCGLDGTCANGIFADVCAAEAGSFDDFFTCAGIASCEVRGCCCDGGSASITTEAACAGTYLGDGKSCAGVDCGTGACCNGNAPCSEVSQSSCAAVDDNYFGDGTTCVELGVDCSVGACCTLQQTCSIKSKPDCQASGGIPQVGGTDCTSDADICTPRGACCVDGTCNDGLTQLACENMNGLFVGENTLCSDGACDVGACCNGESPCAEVSQASCAAAEDNYFGDGTTCAGLDVDCSVGGCCSRLETCSVASKVDCETPGGIHQRGGTDCASSSCVISILSSTPDAGAIDARQPWEPEPTAPEEIVLIGWDQFDINFTGNPFFLAPQDFVVELNPGGEGVAIPSIVSVVVTGTGAAIQLDQPIPVGQWTIIRHISSDTITWLGNLPGDVNADRAVVGNFEVLAMLDCINNPLSCNLWQCDTNRSDTCTPADVLRLIDIISGVGAFVGLGAGTLPAFP